MLLYTHFAYPFEVAGVILLVAIIASITLAFRGRINRKSQRPADQINVNPKDRVRVVKMPSEKKL
jgi:NADH-quinone oxidoreductase subunit J